MRESSTDSLSFLIGIPFVVLLPLSIELVVAWWKVHEVHVACGVVRPSPALLDQVLGRAGTSCRPYAI